MIVTKEIGYNTVLKPERSNNLEKVYWKGVIDIEKSYLRVKIL